MMLFPVVLLLLLMIFGPQLWTRYLFRRWSVPIAELPGTGAELAEHLVFKHRISGVRVEPAATGADHYDPASRAIRLSPEVYHGKSLTAVVIAAHETGHALQHHTGYLPLLLRWKLAGYLARAEKTAALLLVAAPLLTLLTRMPWAGLITLLAGLVLLSLPVVFHLVTLPVEWDASFGRALPLLRDGGYLPPAALPVARRLLAAAALTYLAASLSSMLNFYRWLVFLRR